MPASLCVAFARVSRPQSGAPTLSPYAHLAPAQAKEFCKQPHVTFTMVRDPYDRLASSYLDKVVLQLGTGCNEPRRLLRERGIARPTFEQFIDVLVGVPLSKQDPHTQPFSHRCATNHFEYDLVGRLRTFDQDMAALFEALALRGWRKPYQPVHSRDLALLSKTGAKGTEMNRTLAAFGLRPDVLFLHGQERVDYFYTEAIREKVKRSFWKEDVEMFAEY